VKLPSLATAMKASICPISIPVSPKTSPQIVMRLPSLISIDKLYDNNSDHCIELQ
jgi:hypothetical protein